MNVLSITSSYPKFDGDPTAPFIESITRHVAARGHTTHVVLPEHAGWNRSAPEDGIHFHPYRYSPSRAWTPWGFAEALEAGVRIKRPLYALAPVVFLSALRTCGRLTARVRFDLVHAHWVVPNGPIGARVARRRRLPLVVSLHGSDVSVSERHGWMGRMARRTFAAAAAVTAPSEDLLERARRLGATGRLELIPYGADLDAFRVDPRSGPELRGRLGFGEDDVLVLGIGRFVHWKGFDDLIEAVARARSTRPAIRLVLVGDGDLREELMAHADRLGLAEAVTFPGPAGRDEVPAYLAAADVVAVPSVHFQGYVDGLPNVALEAMAAARPLVATRVGGLPQVVRDGENGLLVAERDPNALADAILTLAADPELRRALGDCGRERIRESLTWDAVAERFEAVYEHVTS